MTTDQKRKRLAGDRNQCPGCGAYFNRSSGFERHRIGSYNDSSDPRRCADPATRDMHLGSDGFWRMAAGNFKHSEK